MKPARCKVHAHHDIPMKRGSRRVRCTACGDEFPCRHACEHLDCIVATDRPLPEWAGEGTREALLAELAIIAPSTIAVPAPKLVCGEQSPNGAVLEVTSVDSGQIHGDEAHSVPYEYGELFVGGHNLGPARRNLAIDVIELGPHITGTAGKPEAP